MYLFMPLSSQNIQMSPIYSALKVYNAVAGKIRRYKSHLDALLRK